MYFGPIGQPKSERSDATRWDLFHALGSVVKELKKVVLHLSFMTDNHVKSEDIE